MTDIKAKLLKLQTNLENIDASSPTSNNNENDSEPVTDTLIDDTIDSESNYNSINVNVTESVQSVDEESNSNVEESGNGNTTTADGNNNAGEDVSMAETVEVSNDVEMSDN